MKRIEQSKLVLNLDEIIRPSVERMLTGTTKLDSEIGALSIPTKPYFVRFAILLLRAYRKIRPAKIGNRCVYEPSCSHYSEMAIRENGIRDGIRLSFTRLKRCRPGAGGIDLPPKGGK